MIISWQSHVSDLLYVAVAASIRMTLLAPDLNDRENANKLALPIRIGLAEDRL
jgi:hypothetical protein